MKRLTLFLAFELFCLHAFPQNNCQFARLSNDTVFQDYIERVFDDPANEEIIVIGTKMSRNNSSNFLYRAPFFQKYNYCGDLILDKGYPQVDSLIVWNHEHLLTNRTNIFEPIENRTFKDQNGLYCIALRVLDTLTNKVNFVIVGLDRNGNISKKVIVPLSDEEFYKYAIKNIKLLSDNKILLILYNALTYQYLFLYFNVDYTLFNKKIFDLNAEIYGIEEIATQTYICAENGKDLKQFKIFSVDSAGDKTWEYNPYPSRKGAVRQVRVIENKIVIVGYINKADLMTTGQGLITTLGTNGKVINEIVVSDSIGNLLFQSVIKDSQGHYTAAGYSQRANADSSGTNIILYTIDTSSNILWDTSYNFISKLGTSDNGYYNDYGGFDLIEIKDNSLITFGINIYKSASSFDRTSHNDGILIKTKPGFITNANESKLHKSNLYLLEPNPVIDELHIKGDLCNIQSLRIFDFKGQLMLSVAKNDYSLSVCNFVPGLYILHVVDMNKVIHKLKFVKI